MRAPTEQRPYRPSVPSGRPHGDGTAWQYPGTRLAWTGALLRCTVGVPPGLAVIGGYVAAVWAVPFLVVLFPFIFGGVIGGLIIQVPAVRRMLWLRRLLRTYPWQAHEKGLPHSVDEGPLGKRLFLSFKVPNPDAPQSWINTSADAKRGIRWWTERMSAEADPEAKADIGTLWFAGDPRFRGVLAVPGKRGPRRLLRVARWEADEARPRDASPEALRSAHRAGVRLPELALPRAASGASVEPAPEPPTGPAWEHPATRWSLRLLMLWGALTVTVTLALLVWLFLNVGADGSAATGKWLGILAVVTVVPAYRQTRACLAVRRRLHEAPWRRLDVEVRRRRGGLVLIAEGRALRTHFTLRRTPNGRTQVWFAGDIATDGAVSLRGNGAVLLVRCKEHGHGKGSQDKAKTDATPRPTRKWGSIGRSSQASKN